MPLISRTAISSFRGTVKQGWTETNQNFMDIAYMPEFDAFIVASRNNGLQVRNRNMEYAILTATIHPMMVIV
jgi:hypothetical protein